MAKFMQIYDDNFPLRDYLLMQLRADRLIQLFSLCAKLVCDDDQGGEVYSPNVTKQLRVNSINK